jgi:serine-type D-Ala-D-Ala carboxypeptidase/endopeptidase (penicillin-binding protein 4)
MDEDPLREWARALAEMGIERIEGRIIGDGSSFDGHPFAEGWDIDYFMRQPTRILGFSTSGLAYHDNIARVGLRTARAGAPPLVSVHPSSYLQVTSQLQTSARQRGNDVRVVRSLGSDTVVLTGSLPHSHARSLSVPVADPVLFTAASFEEHLRLSGIVTNVQRVDGATLDMRALYSGAQPLFVYQSPSLAEIIEPINKQSNNFYAEQLFRTIGWNGSNEGAERRVKALLSRAGASTSGLAIRDGSGLSRKNYITPEAMTRLLVFMNRHEEREAFLNSLPTAGESRSTMRFRLGGSSVQAKTGSLDHVRALAGYTRTADGRRVAFSVMTNNFSAPAWHMNEAIDQVVATISSR